MPSKKAPVSLRIPPYDSRRLDALIEELEEHPTVVEFPGNRNRVTAEALALGVEIMISRLPESTQARIAERARRRVFVQIKNNAILGGFPTGGPYVRDGIPPLRDGEYELLEQPDGSWRTGETIVLRRLFPTHNLGA
jgi:hypothetical protein